jgi:hypothetical protein
MKYAEQQKMRVKFRRNLTCVGTTLLVLKAGETRRDRRGDIECHQALGIAGSDVHPRDIQAYGPVEATPSRKLRRTVRPIYTVGAVIPLRRQLHPPR